MALQFGFQLTEWIFGYRRINENKNIWNSLLHNSCSSV
jgi:hypothetical protein